MLLTGCETVTRAGEVDAYCSAQQEFVDAHAKALEGFPQAAITGVPVIQGFDILCQE